MLKQLFDMQARQQEELGLDPKHMDDHERTDRARRVLLGIHEEVTELQKLTTSYKRHLLSRPVVNKENIADECADIFKYLVSLAQMHDISSDDFSEAFRRKTLVTSAKARYDRFKLVKGDKVLVVDVDDVVADLSCWQQKLHSIKSAIPDNEDKLRVVEEFKDRFYRAGGFRDLDVIPGAKRSLVKFSEAGYKIAMITARPAQQYKRLYADTLTWLTNHGIPHDKVIFNKDKVEAIQDHIMPAWPVAFVEDHPKNALGLAFNGVPVLLFNQPHNESLDCNAHSNITRVSSWSEVEHLILYKDRDEELEQQGEYTSSMRGE